MVFFIITIQSYADDPHSVMSALLKFLVYIFLGSNPKIIYVLSYKVFISQEKIITIKIFLSPI